MQVDDGRFPEEARRKTRVEAGALHDAARDGRMRPEKLRKRPGRDSESGTAAALQPIAAA